MNRLRVHSMVGPCGHITPHSSSCASASAARMQARISTVFNVSSASFSSTCGRLRVAECLRHQVRQPQHELAFREVLGGALVRGMGGEMRAHRGVVQPVHLAQQEHALPRHQHVVEEHDAVHLLEARAERMVEMRAADVEAVAAEEAQAGRAAGNGEVQHEGIVAAGVLRGAWRIDRDFVGQRPERGQHAGAAHDDAGIGLARPCAARCLPAG